ncbi:CYP722 protein [Hibiscus syriacus]|uniref:CYP722 protein n=1 Tax=Hibiscus syriacus TaxID=106335 RepID=A0A6A2XND8_HIBSY|nr:uncharacterized protein LOC120190418 [Hibiscus syriacus]KAE8659899.1 CYP722 protein [Hibiscus syriacus]
MASFGFDNVMVRKEDALCKYNMEWNLKIGVSFIGFLLVLFLLPWSLFPTVEVAGDFARYLVSTFNKPLFAFILVNSIIIVVYVLSNQNQSWKPTASPDIYDEYLSSRRSVPTSAATTAAPAKEETMVDKQIILVENAVALVSPVEQQPTIGGCDTVTEAKRSVSPVKQQPPPTENRTAPTEVIKQKEYRRSRSLVSESRNQRSRMFRRSETAMISREMMVTGSEPPRKSMDEMSSEEFQSIIDSFIAEKKKTLMQENTAHYTGRKDKCMSIVVKN